MGVGVCSFTHRDDYIGLELTSFSMILIFNIMAIVAFPHEPICIHFGSWKPHEVLNYYFWQNKCFKYMSAEEKSSWLAWPQKYLKKRPCYWSIVQIFQLSPIKVKNWMGPPTKILFHISSATCCLNRFWHSLRVPRGCLIPLTSLHCLLIVATFSWQTKTELNWKARAWKISSEFCQALLSLPVVVKNPFSFLKKRFPRNVNIMTHNKLLVPFPEPIHTHTSNDDKSHSYGLQLRKQRLPVFGSLLLQH